ncbi:hypothetical protein KUV35_02310 [Marinobacter salsuginis]|uniref:hypothetical protein n=1 Tax=Marinobacter salsuginis TaxID=418719 RepID=UPI001C955D73|nr:hypothetical protein [Marinobacter salsuginis]MBY6070113.1 hypothetical protein [Marinobacter salsuginis]
MSIPFFRILESAAGIISLLVAAGYLSLRAHLNHLGISVLEEMGVERILSETASLAQALLMYGLVSVLLLAVVILIITIIRRALKLPFRYLHRRYPDFAQHANTYSSYIAFFVFCAIYLVWHVYLFLILGDASSVAVGVLEKAKLASIAPWVWFGQVTVFLLAIQAGFQLIRNGSGALPGWLIKSAGAYLIASALIVTPTVFGIAGRPKDYSTAFVSLAEHQAPQCGLLVLITPQHLVLWQTEGQLGRVIYLPKSRVRSLMVGSPANIMDLGRLAIQNKAEYSTDAICHYLKPVGQARF